MLQQAQENLFLSEQQIERMREQKEADELVIKNEMKFRHALDNMLEGVQMHDFDWRYIYVNDALVKFSPYSREEMIGYTLMEKYPGIEQTDLYKTMHRCLHGRIAEQLETEFVFPDGRVAFYELMINPIPEGISILSLDITEKKNAEQAQAESKKLIQTIYGACPDAVIIVDALGKITKWDEKSEALLGWKEIEVINKDLAEIIIPDRYRLRHQAGMQHYLETGEGTIVGKSIDISALKKNGHEFEISLSISPTEIDGKTHFIGFIRDISDKKIAEKQKEFEQNNLTALINNTKDLMWSVDRDFKLITSNQAFTDMIRFMSGKTVKRETEVLSLGFPDEQVKRYKRYYERAFAGESFTVIEFTPEPADFWSEISFHPILKGENVIGTACYARDITEIKKSEATLIQSEKRLKEAQETAHIGSWNLDFATHKGSWSEEACRIYGLPENEKWHTYTDWISFLHPDDLQYVMKANDDAQKTFSDTSLHHRIILKDGTIKHVNSISRFEFDQHGNAIGLYGIAHDVTEQKIAEKEKEKMMQDFEKAREQEQLAVTDAVITGEEQARQEMGFELHDNINQILATAQLYLGMFLKKNPVPNNFIQKTDEMIVSAIKEIRDLAHSTISPFIGDDSLPEALETLSAITERSGAVKITRKFTNLEEIPIPEKLKLAIYRVVQEQFQNILKYAKAKNIYLELHCEQCIVSLLIRDDGVGFDTSKKANGIGMKNIKTRISLFRGEMEIISSAGNGCILSVKCHYPCI
ncbi:MAG: PAS domain S-box protein [Bacteroidota bacterium]